MRQGDSVRLKGEVWAVDKRAGRWLTRLGSGPYVVRHVWPDGLVDLLKPPRPRRHYLDQIDEPELGVLHVPADALELCD